MLTQTLTDVLTHSTYRCAETEQKSHLIGDVVQFGTFIVGGIAIKAGAGYVASKIASKLVPAVSAASNIDPNKINHIFNKAEHNLGNLVNKFGGNVTEAYMAVQNAAQKIVDTNKLTGIFDSVDNPIIVKVKDITIHVGGNVIDGILKFGTFFVK